MVGELTVLRFGDSGTVVGSNSDGQVSACKLCNRPGKQISSAKRNSSESGTFTNQVQHVEFNLQLVRVRSSSQNSRKKAKLVSWQVEYGGEV